MSDPKSERITMIRCCAALPAIAALGLLAGCSTAGSSPLPTGAAAYEVVPEVAPRGFAADAIKPGDKLSIRVFGEPELTADDYIVDAGGYIQVPLIGELIVAEQSPRSVAAEIERRLETRYVRNASVTVSLLLRPQSTFTVEGDVNQPGVFPSLPNSTLLSALAQAKSPTKTALLSEVIIFRHVNGERSGGRFNLSDIRRGRAPDPQILAGDTVVVGKSAIKAAWQDFLQAAPLFNIFYAVRN